MAVEKAGSATIGARDQRQVADPVLATRVITIVIQESCRSCGGRGTYEGLAPLC